MPYTTDPCKDEVSPDDPCVHRGEPDSIIPEEVQCAQQQWCDGLLEISRSYNADRYGDYRDLAEEFIKRLYDFEPGGKVFFRPTLATFPDNFRTTYEGTLEYFVGTTDEPEDGFAKKKFKSIKFSNRLDDEGTIGIQIHDLTAMAMGNVCFDEEGKGLTVVDKTFVYVKHRNTNQLKLVVHMSALRNEGPGNAVE